MTLEVPSILAWSLVGMLTGAIAAQFLTGRGYGMGGDIGVGILGALVGGLLLSLLGLHGQGGLVASTGAAFAGAVLLTRLARDVRREAPAEVARPHRQ